MVILLSSNAYPVSGNSLGIRIESPGSAFVFHDRRDEDAKEDEMKGQKFWSKQVCEVTSTAMGLVR